MDHFKDLAQALGALQSSNTGRYPDPALQAHTCWLQNQTGPTGPNLLSPPSLLFLFLFRLLTFISPLLLLLLLVHNPPVVSRVQSVLVQLDKQNRSVWSRLVLGSLGSAPEG